MAKSSGHLLKHISERVRDERQRRAWSQQLLADRMAFEDYNLDTPRTQGYGFARVQRLAVQHLLGAR